MPEQPPDPHHITTLEALQTLYGTPGEASIRKECSFLHPVYQRWVAAAPFAVLATVGPDGVDTSPRGDPRGLVKVRDARTLLLPDRRGNNRIDSLRNLLVDPRLSLLFLIPGIGETLRVIGRGQIRTDPVLLEELALAGQHPRCVIEISVERVYFQCARAVLRSRLWDTADPATRAAVPSAGAMLEAITDSAIDGDAYDSALPQRQRGTLY